MAIEVKCGDPDRGRERRDVQKLKAYKRELKYVYAVLLKIRGEGRRGKLLTLKWVGDER
jgi:hypothetical protein